MDPKLLAALREYIDAQSKLEAERTRTGEDGYPVETWWEEVAAKEAWERVEVANAPHAAE